MNKFKSVYEEEAERFNQALENVYKNKFNFFAGPLAWIRLYVMTEKRGFYIIIDGNEITCVDDLVFAVIPNCKPRLDESTN